MHRYGGKLNLRDRTDFELPTFIIETPQGAKKIIFDPDGNLEEIRPATEKSQSLQEIKNEYDKYKKKIQIRIDMGINAEYYKERLKAYPKMIAELERQAAFKASAESGSLSSLQQVPPIPKSKS